MICTNCSIDFEGRKDAKFCSPKCRVTFSRKQSVVTDNVTLKEIDVTDNFEFYTITKAHPQAKEYEDTKSDIRTAKYWYNIPLGAIPVMQKGFPAMPEYMNGRQYFLWWKNNFEIKDDMPLIHNPFPKYDNLTYVMAGEQSRRWGA